jgi:hypothetical protein
MTRKDAKEKFTDYIRVPSMEQRVKRIHIAFDEIFDYFEAKLKKQNDSALAKSYMEGGEAMQKHFKAEIKWKDAQIENMKKNFESRTCGTCFFIARDKLMDEYYCSNEDCCFQHNPVKKDDGCINKWKAK